MTRRQGNVRVLVKPSAVLVISPRSRRSVTPSCRRRKGTERPNSAGPVPDVRRSTAAAGRRPSSGGDWADWSSDGQGRPGSMPAGQPLPSPSMKVLVAGSLEWMPIQDANAYTVDKSGALWLWEWDKEKAELKRRLAIFAPGGWLGIDTSDLNAPGLFGEVERPFLGFKPLPG